LSKIAGFNIKDKIFKLLDIKPISTLSVKDLSIQDITLLSIGEAESVPEQYRQFYTYWWLRSPGNSHDYAAVVSPGGGVNSIEMPVYIDNRYVRPALIISNLKSFKLPIYSKVELDNGTKWIIISDNMLLCNDGSFGKLNFDEDSNDYDNSEIKQYIHEKARELGF